MAVQKLSELDMQMLDGIFSDKFYEEILKRKHQAAEAYRELYTPKAAWDVVPENNSE